VVPNPAINAIEVIDFDKQTIEVMKSFGEFWHPNLQHSSL